MGEEMSARSRERIAADESTVIAELSLGVYVVEGLEGDGSFPEPPWADQSEGFEAYDRSDDLIDQPPAPETDPWRRGRQFSERNTL